MCVLSHTQAHFLPLWTLGEKKHTKPKITFFNNHVDVSTTTMVFSSLVFRVAISKLGWEQNFGGNKKELFCEVFIPNEHLLLSIIPQATTDQLILALK